MPRTPLVATRIGTGSPATRSTVANCSAQPKPNTQSPRGSSRAGSSSTTVSPTVTRPLPAIEAPKTCGPDTAGMNEPVIVTPNCPRPNISGVPPTTRWRLESVTPVAATGPLVSGAA